MTFNAENCLILQVLFPFYVRETNQGSMIIPQNSLCLQIKLPVSKFPFHCVMLLSYDCGGPLNQLIPLLALCKSIKFLVSQMANTFTFLHLSESRSSLLTQSKITFEQRFKNTVCSSLEYSQVQHNGVLVSDGLLT